MGKVADRPTLADIQARRDEILRVATAHGATNVRIFGSVARDEAGIGSDIDLLVDIVSDARGLAYFGLVEDLRRDLSDVLDYEVDVVDSAGLRSMREHVLREAIPL